MQSPSKSQYHSSQTFKEKYSTSCGKTKTRDSQTILYNKGTSGRITIPDNYSNEKALYWHKHRQVDQWNQIEDLNINPHTYEHMTFNKETKIVQWKKDSTDGECQHVEECK